MNFNATLFGQLLAFVFFVWFTMLYVWPYILEALEEREKEISDGLEAASRGKRELDEAHQKKAEILEEAKKEAAGAAAKVESEAFLAENAKHKDVNVTASGLQYTHLTVGKGENPTAASTVTVHYRGTLIDGTEFDSSYKRGEPISFPLGNVIKGWTEGLQLMKPGGKTKFYIPQELAYGANPTPNGPIPPYAALLFEVELISFQ